MFTGIIESVGQLTNLENRQGDVRLTIDLGDMNLSDVKLGDSIACNGVCLTVIKLAENAYMADVSQETLRVTTLGNLKKGDPVNLEKSLRLQDRLGGHMVSGHVDAVAEVVSIEQQARSWVYKILVPEEIARYIAGKGSVCINGISLTVNDVDGLKFSINIVPHTRENTTIRHWQLGTKVNVEVDMLSRYLERLLQSGFDEDASKDFSPEFLAEHGYT